MGRTIQGVDGPITRDALGVTLTHEHVVVDLRAYWSAPREATRLARARTPVEIHNVGALRRNPFGSPDNLVFDDVATAVAELSAFRGAGGDTVVDLSLPDIGRDVVALRTVARMTGVQIIAGCGHYVHIAHPPELSEASVDDIAARFIHELEVGIDDTGIRAGVIGEIGTTAPVHPDEDKVLRAAARAHRQTGAPIAVHLSPPPNGTWWQGHEVLDVLEGEDVGADRVLLSHLDNVLGPGDDFDRAIRYHRELAARGCYLGFDGCGKEHYFPSGSRATYPNFWCPSDQIRAKAAAVLADEGLADRLLLSHDVCFKIELERFGGFGYGHILRTFGSNLADYGLDGKVLQQMLVDNTRRFLCPADDGR